MKANGLKLFVVWGISLRGSKEQSSVGSLQSSVGSLQFTVMNSKQ